ncbi:5-methylaminomethyl-2-thiouridylate-methyltransferase [Amylocystis lapponica]|nr:5-methylaminomethyl-2-thiouridylate-methyltransferase [Amylocystis lapponica]
MSGGVDSSVTARLLMDKDYDLSAVFMRNWDTRDESGSDSGCEWKKDWHDVQRVCKMLDIPCRMIDLSREYWTRVFEPSLQRWELGQTPNPDVWCNKEVKFGALLDHLTSKDTWIATGHYAKKSWSSPPSLLSRFSARSSFPSNLRPKLLRPADRSKDQTYYLSAIPEVALARAFFPLADFHKIEVREMAKKWALPTAQREESMGICFVGEKRRFDNFLEYITPKPGPIIDLTTGKTLGRHRGLWSYTIGQGARIAGLPQKMFVAKKDLHTNVIYVVPGADHAALYHRTIIAENWKWIWADSPPVGTDHEQGFRGQCQFIYRMQPAPCTVKRGDSDGTMLIKFDEPYNHIAPGQIVTISDGDWCLGCGTVAQME